MGDQPERALPALKTNPNFIFFTDFDGTITMQDSNDFLIEEHGAGPTVRKALFDDVLYLRRTFRDVFKELLDDVHVPFDKCVEALVDNITLDPGFKEFYAYAKAHNIPIVVLSGGMEPIIRALLGHLLGEDEAATLPILSNFVAPRPGKTSINEERGWEIKYRDDSSFGHDKSVAIRPYASLPEGERPVLFYAGDGVSDLSAAKETDLLFARAGKDLVTYCKTQNVPFTTFESFREILKTVQKIVAGETSVKEVAARGR